MPSDKNTSDNGVISISNEEKAEHKESSETTQDATNDSTIATTSSSGDIIVKGTTNEMITDSTISHTLLDNTPKGTLRTCYSNDTDFQIMFKLFWPTIQQFIIINPDHDHDHSMQWKSWMAQGLDPINDLATPKQILGTTALDQMHLFFRDSPALVVSFDITWDLKIHYRLRVSMVQEHNVQTPIQVNKTSAGTETDRFKTPVTIHNLINTSRPDLDFMIFHKTVFNIIDRHVHGPGGTSNEPCHHVWRKWVKQGLRHVSTFPEISNIMRVQSVDQYVMWMQQFSIFQDTIEVT
jgi:hypothetical protein